MLLGLIALLVHSSLGYDLAQVGLVAVVHAMRLLRLFGRHDLDVVALTRATAAMTVVMTTSLALLRLLHMRLVINSAIGRYHLAFFKVLVGPW